ncbi:hypothetical protein TREES_T100007320 [Tupaia chinensis]|uniref:Uncharacterized protein n=1 Tax=Tupaia chinensis TaxID=246437 RepID=L9KZQ4_TUPCH|nr:hypothetical protein TREES_T100007320 [Tupaia chinensis]
MTSEEDVMVVVAMKKRVIKVEQACSDRLRTVPMMPRALGQCQLLAWTGSLVCCQQKTLGCLHPWGAAAPAAFLFSFLDCQPQVWLAVPQG